jgi:hypothetical protein
MLLDAWPGARRRGEIRSSSLLHHALYLYSVPGADLSEWDDYEINLDQRVLSPEICMAACMAHGRPAGWLRVQLYR